MQFPNWTTWKDSVTPYSEIFYSLRTNVNILQEDIEVNIQYHFKYQFYQTV